MSSGTATLAGFGAILLWALLALLTSLSGEVPPFQLAAMSFAVGGAIGAVFVSRHRRWQVLRGQPQRVWALGIGGLFGYHFLYFSALRAAPAVEASLIAYLWPLLIVVGSGLLPGERLRWFHVVGALVGFAGAVVIVTGGSRTGFDPSFATGYGLALAAALVWSSYSVLSRRFAAVPTEIVTGFCVAAAVLAALCHLIFEDTVWPRSGVEWLAVLGLGLGPLGLAFFLWDRGMKRGDIQVLGAASYAAPLLSTLVLIAAGVGVLTWGVAVACILITSGAVLASKDMLRGRVRRSAGE